MSALLTALLLACAEPPAQSITASPANEAGIANTPGDSGTDAAPALPLDASTAFAVDAQLALQDAATSTFGDAAGFADAVVPDLPADAGSASALRVSLVSPDHWTLLDAGADPFDDRPAVVDCLPAGVAAEVLGDERVLGIETGWCGYLTAQQPTRRAVAVGEVLKVRLWHFELTAPEPAEAHAVLQIDGLRVLDERIAIPQPGALIVKQLRVERAIAAGAPVQFHLHNHGANTWALVEVSVGPP
jgi:hypothetical protein